MSALADYAENLVLDWLMTNGSATRPTSWYVALYTAAPNDAGGGTEVTGAGYARQSVTFGAASGGAASNNSVATFTASGGDFGTISHIGIHDAVSGGNLIWHGSLAAARTVVDGDSISFASGAIDLTID